MHAPARLIRKADRRAARRLRAVLVAGTYNDPEDRTTRLYHEAERLLDRLQGEPVRWAWEAASERAVVMGGAYYDLSISLPDVPLADKGDHYAGMAS